MALILLIMYVGGMLVTLAYFLALCPNQSATFSPVMFVPFFLGFTLLPDSPSQPMLKASELQDIYSRQNRVTLLFLALILFLTIIRVVKIVSRNAGALRPFMI